MKKIRFHAGAPLGDRYNGLAHFSGDGDTKEVGDEIAASLLRKFPKPKASDRREFYFEEVKEKAEPKPKPQAEAAETPPATAPPKKVATRKSSGAGRRSPRKTSAKKGWAR